MAATFQITRALCIFIGSLLLLSPAGATAQNTTSLVSAQKEYQRYVSHIAQNNFDQYTQLLQGRNPVDLVQTLAISSDSLNRQTAEMLVMQAAIGLSGCRCELVFKPHQMTTVHARSIELVRSGTELTHGIGGFSGDSRYHQGLYLSQPIIAAQDFYVGLYTHENRHDILSLTDPQAILKLRYAVGENWEIDNQILQQFGLTITPADNWKSLLAMLVNGRADVVLQPFSRQKAMAFTEFDQVFKPIPGVKLPFPHARQFFVSKKHPDGATFLTRLNKGIDELRKRKRLRKIMVLAGVIHQQAQGFVNLIEPDAQSNFDQY